MFSVPSAGIDYMISIYILFLSHKTTQIWPFLPKSFIPASMTCLEDCTIRLEISLSDGWAPYI